MLCTHIIHRLCTHIMHIAMHIHRCTCRGLILAHVCYAYVAICWSVQIFVGACVVSKCCWKAALVACSYGFTGGCQQQHRSSKFRSYNMCLVRAFTRLFRKTEMQHPAHYLPGCCMSTTIRTYIKLDCSLNLECDFQGGSAPGCCIVFIQTNSLPTS